MQRKKNDGLCSCKLTQKKHFDSFSLLTTTYSLHFTRAKPKCFNKANTNNDAVFFPRACTLWHIFILKGDHFFQFCSSWDSDSVSHDCAVLGDFPPNKSDVGSKESKALRLANPVASGWLTLGAACTCLTQQHCQRLLVWKLELTANQDAFSNMACTLWGTEPSGKLQGAHFETLSNSIYKKVKKYLFYYGCVKLGDGFWDRLSAMRVSILSLYVVAVQDKCISGPGANNAQEWD